MISQHLSRENTGTRKETRNKAFTILNEVFDSKDSDQYRDLGVFPDSREHTLEGT